MEMVIFNIAVKKQVETTHVEGSHYDTAWTLFSGPCQKMSMLG